MTPAASLLKRPRVKESSGWHEPWKYYDNLTMMNVSAEAMPCIDSVMAENSSIYTYLRITGDEAGVVMPSAPRKSYVARWSMEMLTGATARMAIRGTPRPAGAA